MEKNPSTMDIRKQLKDPQSAGSRGLINLAKSKLKENNPLRRYIDIIDANQKIQNSK